VLTGTLRSDDTDIMVECLLRLGIDVQIGETHALGGGRSDRGATIRVSGCDGEIPSAGAELFVGNSGTTVRFLTAMLTLGRGRYVLDGVPRMRERPIQDLLDALAQLGADVASAAGTGCPPVVIQADGLAGGHVAIRGDISSQYLSGLLMAAPYARRETEIAVQGDLVSRPYVAMTLSVMHSFGAQVQHGGDRFVVSPTSRYRGRTFAIEPDASAASYFWAAAAITGGDVTVQGLSRQSLQGDVAFCECLRLMGCQVEYQPEHIRVCGPARLRGVQVDMNAISDTVQTLAVTALFADGPTVIRGVGHIRHKETDRLGDLARELRRLGADVEELPDGLRITPRPLHGTLLQSYDDHRMAMSLALAGLKIPGVMIQNPDCTAKTYPGFFADLDHVLERR
jgi:3-phosphoshikimate 1-carboxyvinyltransferase